MNNLIVVEAAMEIAHTRDFLRKLQTSTARRGAVCGHVNSVGGIGPSLQERIGGKLGLNVIGVSLLYDNVWTQGVHQWGPNLY